METLSSRYQLALDQLRQAFPAKPSTGVGFCAHCFEIDEMSRFLVRQPGGLTAYDLDPIFQSAYHTWGDWPSLSAYVPRMLELYAEGAWIDEATLFYKLLWAARPELVVGRWSHAERALGRPMTRKERQAIFRAVGSLLGDELGSDRPYVDQERIWKSLGFLAAFDGPLTPFIERWSEDDRPLACARLSVLLTQVVFDPELLRGCTRTLYTVSVLPENLAAFADLRQASWVAEYLARHISSVDCFFPDQVMEVEWAFDQVTAAAK